jgi:hypothetical protein
LATFSWMFIDGIELFIALKHVFKIDRIRLIAYSLYSYGFPLLFVILSIMLSVKDGNGLSQLYVFEYLQKTYKIEFCVGLNFQVDT